MIWHWTINTICFGTQFVCLFVFDCLCICLRLTIYGISCDVSKTRKESLYSGRQCCTCKKMETAVGKRGRPKKKKGRPTTRDTVVDQKLPKHRKKKVYHHQYYEDYKEENAGDTDTENPSWAFVKYIFSPHIFNCECVTPSLLGKPQHKNISVHLGIAQ